MDSFIAILPLLAQYLPDLVGLLKRAFAGSSADTEAAIAAILGMRSPEQIEADVDAGQLPEPWASRRSTANLEKTLGDVAFGLIMAQAVTGTKPDSMTDEEFQQAITAARAAHTGLTEAHGQCTAAIAALDAQDFETAHARLLSNLTALGTIKIKVCPVIHKEDD